MVAQVEFFFDNGKNKFEAVEGGAFLVEQTFTTDEVLPRVHNFAVQLLEETAADLGNRGWTLSELPVLAAVACCLLLALVEDRLHSHLAGVLALKLIIIAFLHVRSLLTNFAAGSTCALETLRAAFPPADFIRSNYIANHGKCLA